MGQSEHEGLTKHQQVREVFNAMVKDTLLKQGQEGQPINNIKGMFDPNQIVSLLSDKVEIDSAKLLQSQMRFMEQQTALWQQASMAFMGEQFNPVIHETKGDNRFKHDEWNNNPAFNYMKQAYLLNSQMLENVVDALHFKDDKTAEQIKFYTRQYISSVSPTNYVLTNPEVCEEILKSNGESILKGMQNFMADLEQSPLEAFKITQTDPDAFTVGENLATTEGQVIYKNELIELIHYTPKRTNLPKSDF